MNTNGGEPRAIVIGGGPAGLTAGFELCKHGVDVLVLEKSASVGGLARTAEYKGYYFDMGGHRFYTKSEEVRQIWHEVLGDDLLERPRLSRIYYRGKFFDYPLKPLNALRGLGLWESFRILLSYSRWQLFPYREEETFEQWVTNRFGRRLFQTFFQSYTEKVWGISTSELRAEWAAQRIKDLSLRTALISMFLKPRKTIKTLIERFEYPRLGPGMMWQAVQDRIESTGGQVELNADVVRICRSGMRVTAVEVFRDGAERSEQVTDLVSSMPVTELVRRLDPPPPQAVLDAAAQLRYRDFLTVCLVVNQRHLFPDNWIYIHEPGVQVGRIQNYKNWSVEMAADPAMTNCGLEYFCNEGDSLWSMSDAELIELGKSEMELLGLAHRSDVEDACVFRVPKSYPVYDAGSAQAIATIRRFIDDFENLQTIGRNGLHRYNNQDHAMLTGLLAARNICRGERHDLWSVNADQEYLEEETVDEDAAEPASDPACRG